MTVADLMTTDVVTIGSEAPLAEAITLLADARIGGLAVVDRHARLIGAFSASDVLAAEAEAGDDEARARLLSNTLVGDVMTRRVLTVTPETELREASLQMEYGEVHRLFVVQDGILVGVISRSDIVRAHAVGTL